MRLLLFCLGILLLPSLVSAYIDPGTGGMIIGGAGSMIWAFLLFAFGALAAFVAKFYNSLKLFFLGLWKRIRR
jgi:hypothetical protein